MSKGTELLVIGGSAGSLELLLQVLPGIDENLGIAIIIVLHRKSAVESTLQQLLSYKTTWEIKEAEEKEPVLPNTMYIAPADYHLLIENDRTFALDDSEKVNYCRPSIDITLESAAGVYSDKLVCLLLSGANADGVEGLKQAKKNNGYIAVQDPDEAEISFMPQQAVQQVTIDRILKNDEVAAFINGLNKS